MPSHSSKPVAALTPLDVADLLLDAENPRLPEGTTAAEKGKRRLSAAEVQAKILEYFREEGNLDELAKSYSDNGYFQTEPLIVTRDGAPPGKWIVLEGNRRLAALQVVLNGSSDEHSRLDVTVSSALKRKLAAVPVLEVAHREDATAMIGFRHIGGLKFWDSEAKARWIKHQVDAASQTSEPFGHVARMVGMPGSSIRYYYLAASCARVAREESKYNILQLVRGDRFGVFLRALESPGVRGYIGLSKATAYKDIEHDIANVRAKPNHLIAVLDDLSKPLESGKPLIEDSRFVAKYGQMLSDDTVRQVLRNDGYDAALTALAPLKLDEYVRRVLSQVQRLRDKLDSEETLPDTVIERVREIQRVARGLRVQE